MKQKLLIGFAVFMAVVAILFFVSLVGDPNRASDITIDEMPKGYAGDDVKNWATFYVSKKHVVRLGFKDDGTVVWIRN